MYIFLRTDISLAQQIVQSNHAAHEAGLLCKERYNEPSSIVLIQIPDRLSLEQELAKFKALGISCAPFYEPYENTGLTAFCILPIGEESRHLFSDYILWGKNIPGQSSPLNDFLKAEKKENLKKKKLKEREEKSISIIKKTANYENAFNLEEAR